MQDDFAERGRSAVRLAFAAVLLLSSIVFVIDWRGPWGDPAAALSDVSVGVLFALAGLLSPVPVLQRMLALAVASAWLLASVLAVAGLHRALLLALLLAFPIGRLLRLTSWALLGLGCAAILVGSTLLTGVCFAAIAGTTRPWRSGRAMAVRVFPAAAGLTLAVVIVVVGATASLTPSRFDPDVALAVYEAVLALVAVGHLAVSRSWLASTSTVGRLVLEVPEVPPDEPLLAAVASRLGQLLGLDVVAFAAGNRWLHLAGHDRDVLVVVDESGPIATVVGRRAMSAEVENSVITVLRLAARADRLREVDQRRLADIRDSRARLLSAAEAERSRVIARLEAEVVPRLASARSSVAQVRVRDSQGSPLEVVDSELVKASADVRTLVNGLPPLDLAGRTLPEALAELAALTPLPVDVIVDPQWSIPAGAETTAYFLCSEAITNAIKHAYATHLEIHLRVTQTSAMVTVIDNGVGRADASGHGLTGLADRVAVVGGFLTIRSEPDAGTQVTATFAR